MIFIRHQKKTLDRKVKSEKLLYYKNIINTSANKNKAMWHIVSSINGVNRKQNALSINYNGKIISDTGSVADAFASHFSTTITHRITNSFPVSGGASCTVCPNTVHTMSYYPVTADEVTRTIMSLPNKKSTGPDDIPIMLIKKCCDLLSQYLADALNASVYSGRFPSVLKSAAVTPVYKKGDPTDIDNYRPIALVSVFSKIMEKIIADKIYTFLNKYNLISDSQHGFRPGFSTETASVECVQYIFDRMDDGDYVISVFFDLARAFDSVQASFVSNKVHNLGIRGFLNDWLLSFLEYRKIIVRMDGVDSGEYECKLGTPQGSVLGPLIFLLFINDLPAHIPFGKVFLYADDTCIILADKNKSVLTNKVNEVLNSFEKWCFANKLIVNSDKTIFVEFFNKYKNPSNLTFPFNNNIFSTSPSCRVLGTIYDSSLSWAEQVEAVCQRLHKGYFALNSLKNVLDTESLLDVYYANIYSAISYNIIVWGQATEIQRVFVLQKRILRLIFDLQYNVSCRDTFKMYKILTVTSIYLYKLLIFIFSNKHRYLKHSDYHSYNTRNKNALLYNKPNHSFYCKSPFIAGLHFYNLLPSDINTAVLLNTFKNKLKRLLIDGCFYNLTEFEKYLKSYSS